MNLTIILSGIRVVRGRSGARAWLGAAARLLRLPRACSPWRVAGECVSSPKTAEVLTRIWSEQAALAGGADAGSATSQPDETDQPAYPWSRS